MGSLNNPRSVRKKQLDLYLEMMRQENPDFDFIRVQELRSALNTMSRPKMPKSTKRTYRCTTQQHESLDDLIIGKVGGMVHLWESNSVINWIARADGYPSPQHAIEAAVALYRAAEQWNEVMEGRVRFHYVSRFDDAAFQLRYGGDQGGTAARAFTPDQWRKTLNIVSINQIQFDPKHRPFMVNTMLHELGHVLGLRHEFAHEGTPGRERPEDSLGAEGIIFGVRNRKVLWRTMRDRRFRTATLKTFAGPMMN